VITRDDDVPFAFVPCQEESDRRGLYGLGALFFSDGTNHRRVKLYKVWPGEGTDG